MNPNLNFQNGILYLVHLLISADGIIDDKEKQALLKVKKLEQIPDAVFQNFQQEVAQKKEREIYQTGIDFINKCTDDEKINAFVHLYKMSEVDGTIHVKEVRLLLYSIRMAGIEFEDVVKRAAQVSSY